MRLEERQQREIISRMTHEGNPELLVGPVARAPSDVPPLWRDALIARDPSAIIAQLWRPISHRLPRVCHALHERLLGVGLLRTDEVPAGLLYFFSIGNNFFVYRGQPPAREYELEVSPLPPEFLEFYRVHNGWVLDYDEDEGPLPNHRWTLPELIWDEARLKPLPGATSLSDLAVVFRGGADLAFAFDLSSKPPVPVLLSPPTIAHALFDIWVAIDDHVSRFLFGFDRVRTEPGLPAVLAGHYDAQLKSISARAHDLQHLAGPAGHRHWYRLLLERASVEPLSWSGETLNSFHHEALQQGCYAIERSSFVEARELLALFGLAHALGESGAVRFLASVPPQLWLTGSPESLQVNALFELFFGRWDKAALSIEQVVAGLPKDQPDGPTSSLVPHLIAALVQRNRADVDHYSARILRAGSPGPDQDGINLPWSVRLLAFEGVWQQISMLRSGTVTLR